MLTLSMHHSRILAWWPFVAQGELFKRKPMGTYWDTPVTECCPICEEYVLWRILDIDDLVFNLNTLKEFRSNGQLEIGFGRHIGVDNGSCQHQWFSQLLSPNQLVFPFSPGWPLIWGREWSGSGNGLGQKALLRGQVADNKYYSEAEGLFGQCSCLLVDMHSCQLPILQAWKILWSGGLLCGPNISEAASHYLEKWVWIE